MPSMSVDDLRIHGCPIATWPLDKMCVGEKLGFVKPEFMSNVELNGQ